ncbi:hypothetical protein BZG72_15705 [Salinivibrio sp. PR6]|uniref:hypothetical protein n=1 Tax=Salinivibrio sp. PR6 TaxID=1909485 RepID=UPI000989494F|nr:hypothetical protein [Salinivibrio sp. PR6]OOE78235.1 hypothetical protein BZG72_15705 [Salinivibrio sp. PR6]
MFNPDLPVTKLPMFKAVLILGGALTVGATVAIGYHTNLSLCFTATCFNNLLEFFKVPIRLLAATLSIIGLIALAHRSEQSAKQIKLSEEQNIFSNHYKNKEEFWKYIETSPNKDYIKKHASTYDFIFPKSKLGIYMVRPLLTTSEKDAIIKTIEFTILALKDREIENRNTVIDFYHKEIQNSIYNKRVFSFDIFSLPVDVYLDDNSVGEFILYFLSSLSLAIKVYVDILNFHPEQVKGIHEELTLHFHQTSPYPEDNLHINEAYLRDGINFIRQAL